MSNAPGDIAIQDYHYELPEEKIAAFPNTSRVDSKLLVYKQGQIHDTTFSDLPNNLLPDTVLVFNDTKVVTARMLFNNQKGQDIEVFCLGPAETTDPQTALHGKSPVKWLCMVGHLRKWKEDYLSMTRGDITLRVKRLGMREEAQELEFEWWPGDKDFYEVMALFGELPIPPYLNRKLNAQDKERYQTVYARQEGSVAAPTAGLHFNEAMLENLQHQGVAQIRLTLHVGAGTFKPVKASRMSDHHMHSEWMQVSVEQLEQIHLALTKQIICVGTTSLRALETMYWMGVKCVLDENIELGKLEVKQWEVYDLPKDKSALESIAALMQWMNKNQLRVLHCRTQILIAPPYQLKMAKGLITNFHQPQSTLLLLVAAVLGDEWRKVYKHALTHDFKFLSYGDSSLLLK